ncbi:maleylpyruvate isomerase family mycothiol-dependent enzyme [Streptomyces syringium]|uniref:maleylpyruvate isomerase family mycothiol-dependent enzyme n=1 Tax=Streptomyces syringium TaxID=76729 RepID=UPI0033AA36BB
MDTSRLLATLDRDGQLLAEAAARSGLDAPVPTCPEWRVRDLIAHTGSVHRWAARIVGESLTEPIEMPTAPEADGPELLAWFREGHRLLVKTLTAAEPDLRCWTFMPAPSPLAFWIRRQAHETAVHRVDAESALGDGSSPADASSAGASAGFSSVDAEFAADGVEELLMGFHAGERSRVRTDTPRTLRVRATDLGAVWTVRLSDGPPRTERTAEGPADCELAGPVSDLYTALWNRLPLDVLGCTGDASLARLWRERSAIG